MVRILMFIPHLDMLKRFEKVVAKIPKQEDIIIRQVHVFGTPETLAQHKDAEIMIARGMTYNRLHSLFPDKHIIQLQITSYDIMDALIRCKEEYRAKRIALCIHNQEIHAIRNLELVCNAKIDIYDVYDEDSAIRTIEKVKQTGADILVGAGTICGLCDKSGMPRVHIEMKDDAIETALNEAVNAAKTINLERTKANLMHMIINNYVDGIVAISEDGKILAVNNQAYRIFQVPASQNVTGKQVEVICDKFKRRSLENQEDKKEELLELEGKKYYIEYRPIVVDKMGAGTIIIIKSTDSISETENKIRRNLAEKGLTAKYSFEDIIGSSQAIFDNINMAKRYSKVDSNVLIVGETGTGKELFAHSIHGASSRRSQPFVAINCAALPENLLESELFGYVPGAFSGASRNGKVGLFELAHKGTIFLDEIGEIPITLQAKLLRVLQEKEIRRIGSDRVQPIDVRVISATNIDIEMQIEGGKFRSDLYYRLNLLDINVPPLRERNGDIQEMVSYFFTRFACEMGKPIPKLSREAAKVLSEYNWPGNVRELRNICERLTVLNDTEEINEKDVLQLKIFKSCIKERNQSDRTVEPDKVYKSLQPRKKKQILADELGISRTTLWRMEKKI